MPRASEFGLYSGTNLDLDNLKKVALEPTLDNILRFGSDFQEYDGNPPVQRDFEIGKFVVYNTAMVVAPFAGIVKHEHLVRVADHVLSKERIAEELELADSVDIPRIGNRDLPRELQPTDAGEFLVVHNRDGVIEYVRLSQYSTRYGRGTTASREVAAKALREALTATGDDNLLTVPVQVAK